jgi:hypothetical protein
MSDVSRDHFQRRHALGSILRFGTGGEPRIEEWGENLKTGLQNSSGCQCRSFVFA